MHQKSDLPYTFDALEPHIDARTMEIHWGKHHQAYVTNLNNALDGHDDLAALSVEDLLRGIGNVPESIRGAVRNHGGGHANHSLFWRILTPGGASSPGTAGGGHRPRLRQLRRLQGQVQPGRRDPLRQRLGLAGARRGRQARRRLHRQPGFAADVGQDPDPRPRRVGARLLPPLPEPPAGLHRGVLERGQLEHRLEATQVDDPG